MKIKTLLTIAATALTLAACSHKTAPLPRAEGGEEFDKAFAQCIEDMKEAGELHSMMVLRHGTVIGEHFAVPDSAHILWSVSKTFTAAAVGIAIKEGLLTLDEHLVDIFPDELPDEPQEALGRITVRHLLTMNSGQDGDPIDDFRGKLPSGWVKAFMERPIQFEPGSCFSYNSMCAYMLSAAIQRRSGLKLVDYLETRLWKPLGIEHPVWDESPDGVNVGGWGLHLHTEEMARFGQCLLDGGKFGGRQVIPADWVAEMTARQVESSFPGINSVEAERRGMDHNNHWRQGYGYQMWRCMDGGVRADGARGQFIILLPDKDAVIVTTAQIDNMFLEIGLIWKYIYPVL